MNNQSLKVWDRVEIAPHYDLWMQGARFGTLMGVDRNGIAKIEMNHPQVKCLVRVRVEDLKKV